MTPFLSRLMHLRYATTAFLVGVVILFASVTAAEAKRGAPAPFPPVVIGSVRYTAPAEPDLIGYVVATDVASGKELWRQRIYRVFINPAVETDVQWVFITSLIRQDHTLLITNERGEHFTLDVETRKVAKHK